MLLLSIFCRSQLMHPAPGEVLWSWLQRWERCLHAKFKFLAALRSITNWLFSGLPYWPPLLSCIGFFILLSNMLPFPCQNRLYLDCPVALLLLVITLPSLRYLVKKNYSLSHLISCNFKNVSSMPKCWKSKKQQQHHFEVSLRTRYTSYNNPSRAKSLLNTSLKFSLDENRTEETLVSRVAPCQNLPCYPDLNETPMFDTVDYLKWEWHRAQIWSTMCFILWFHTFHFYIFL